MTTPSSRPTMPARHLSVAIARPAAEVAAYAGDPRNLPAWASGLGRGVRPVGDAWVCDSPMGEVEVRFAPPNVHGVLDHEVRLPDGTRVMNPLRVVPNGDGAEVVFTLFRRPGVGDAELERDAATVRADLETLRRVLEDGAA